ncbi:hypothetical protein HDZ31DRAFT_71713 [Schizophyllum fasciatum]
MPCFAHSRTALALEARTRARGPLSRSRTALGSPLAVCVSRPASSGTPWALLHATPLVYRMPLPGLSHATSRPIACHSPPYRMPLLPSMQLWAVALPRIQRSSWPGLRTRAGGPCCSVRTRDDLAICLFGHGLAHRPPFGAPHDRPSGYHRPPFEASHDLRLGRRTTCDSGAARPATQGAARPATQATPGRVLKPESAWSLRLSAAVGAVLGNVGRSRRERAGTCERGTRSVGARAWARDVDVRAWARSVDMRPWPRSGDMRPWDAPLHHVLSAELTAYGARRAARQFRNPGRRTECPAPRSPHRVPSATVAAPSAQRHGRRTECSLPGAARDVTAANPGGTASVGGERVRGRSQAVKALAGGECAHRR